jgi:hypothetical protein
VKNLIKDIVHSWTPESASTRTAKTAESILFAGREGPRERSHKERSFLESDLLFLTDAKFSDERGRALMVHFQAIKFSAGRALGAWSSGGSTVSETLHSG